MFRKILSGIILTLLLVSLFPLAINVKPVRSTWTGTVYIRADGSIDPPDAPISTVDNVTYVFTGDLYDEVVVEKSNIIIEGNGFFVRGAHTEDSKGICLISVHNVTVKNLNIEEFAFGIYLYYSCNNSISENNIENNGYGIYLYHSYNSTIYRNNLENNVVGIQLDDSCNNNILENNLTANMWKCIYLYYSSNNSIYRNNLTANNWKGIWLESSSNNTIYENSITATNYGGIYLYSSSNNTIYRNNIENSHGGIELYYSCGNNIYRNIFFNDGLIVYDSYGNVVLDNLVNGKPLVYLEGVSDFKVRDAGQVILINCSAITVEGLNLSITDIGIELWNTNDTQISGNNIANNDGGIHLSYSYNNTIYGNNITASKVAGIYLYYSCNNSISGNNIADNDVAGIWLRYSSDNIIYHNNFHNRYHVHSEESVNVWDNGYPSGGNYWSDYTEVDLYSSPYQNVTGSDGIGDNAYTIDENNTDRYPLMGPFNSFNTSAGYSVDVISNSTVEDFRYFESNSTIVMDVSNMTADQAFGFCRLTIPHEVVSPPYIVKVNGTAVEYETIYENYAEGISIIYFTYEHSKLEITVIPEFPSATILPLFMLTTSIATFLLKRKRRPKPQPIA